MGLDIRWPIGFMFSFIGALLTAYGLVNRAGSVAQAGGSEININLVWGVVLFVFGLLMLLLAARGGKSNGQPGK